MSESISFLETARAIYLHAIVFAFGAVVGSFLNVCIARLPYDFSVVYPPSRCPLCFRKIPARYNIPILSFLLLGGKSKCCSMKISSRYFFAELLSAVLTLALFRQYGLGINFFYYSAFVFALIALLFIDWEHFILPDIITLPVGFVGVALSYFITNHGLTKSLIGAAGAALAFYLVRASYFRLRKKEGLGIGDIKLVFMFGAFLGPSKTLLSVLLGSFLGTLVAIFLILFRSASRETPVPYGTFLALGAGISLFFGERIFSEYFLFGAWLFEKFL